MLRRGASKAIDDYDFTSPFRVICGDIVSSAIHTCGHGRCELPLKAGLLPLLGEKWKAGIRPIEASKAAIRNGCFTSAPAVRCVRGKSAQE